MAGMVNPPHPSAILREEVITGLETSITEFARHLGFARETLSRILHGHALVSTALAVRLSGPVSVPPLFGWAFRPITISGRPNTASCRRLSGMFVLMAEVSQQSIKTPSGAFFLDNCLS